MQFNGAYVKHQRSFILHMLCFIDVSLAEDAEATYLMMRGRGPVGVRGVYVYAEKHARVRGEGD